MLDAGCWILDAGCWILDAGCWILDAGCWILDAGCSILDAGYSILDAGCSMLEVKDPRSKQKIDGVGFLDWGLFRLGISDFGLGIVIKGVR